MYVQDAMVTEVTTCSPQTSAQEIAMLMWNNDCGAIPVVDAEQNPLGLVTDRDIAMSAALKDRPLRDFDAREIYNSQKVICCRPHDSMEKALELMEENEIRRLPVVDQNGRLCGILSMGDIVSFTRTKGAGRDRDKQIDVNETLDFLRHISAHHQTDRVAARA